MSSIAQTGYYPIKNYIKHAQVSNFIDFRPVDKKLINNQPYFQKTVFQDKALLGHILQYVAKEPCLDRVSILFRDVMRSPSIKALNQDLVSNIIFYIAQYHHRTLSKLLKQKLGETTIKKINYFDAFTAVSSSNRTFKTLIHIFNHVQYLELNLYNKKQINILSQLPNLTSLDITLNTQIDGDPARNSYIAQISTLTNLTTLHLKETVFSKIPVDFKAIQQLSNLTTLHLNNLYSVDDNALHYFSMIQTITSFNINKCNITDIGLNKINKLIKLTSLNIYNCEKITDIGIKALSVLGQTLTSLDLHNCCCITDEGIFSIASNMPNLHLLNLEYLYEITNKSISQLVMLKDLKSLSLFCCPKLTHHIIDDLATMQLTSLSLSGCLEIFIQKRSILKEKLLPYIKLPSYTMLSSLILGPDSGSSSPSSDSDSESH